MKILIANLGSTSLKYRLFDFDGGEAKLVTRGGLERVEDYRAGVDECLGQLTSGGHIESAADLAAVGFKTVLADGVTGCVRLDATVLQAMEAGNTVAPAHNPAYLTGVRVFSEQMPETPLIGLFETAFYQWIPETAKRYAVPQDWYAAGVRRWGFHGASHKFIAERSAELMGRNDVAERVRQLYVDGGKTATDGAPLRVVSCHLGGSSSVTGMRDGVAIGNSMGMSPQSGLPNNNRVGDIDVFAVIHMMRTRGLSVDQVEQQLCKEAGLKGLSGGYNDLRDIQEQADQGNQDAKLALDFLVYETRRWIGSYHFQLGGLEALVFTAGIGENRSETRAEICANLQELGIELDVEKNNSVRAEEAEISTTASKIKVYVIPTNEELVVAREVKRFLDNQ